MPTLSQISKAINVPFEGDGNFQISGPAEPSVATEKQLALAMDKKFLAHLGKGRAKVAFLSEVTVPILFIEYGWFGKAF